MDKLINSFQPQPGANGEAGPQRQLAQKLLAENPEKRYIVETEHEWYGRDLSITGYYTKHSVYEKP